MHAGKGSSPITAIILPGVTCNSQDYALLASQLATRAAQLTGSPWRVVAADLRHHGQSVGGRDAHPGTESGRLAWPAPSDMAAAAADVATLLQRKLGGARPDVVIGHSMGSKVALSLLQQIGGPSVPSMAAGWRPMQVPQRCLTSGEGGGGQGKAVTWGGL